MESESFPSETKASQVEYAILMEHALAICGEYGYGKLFRKLSVRATNSNRPRPRHLQLTVGLRAANGGGPDNSG
jgi:hypothetical protein